MWALPLPPSFTPSPRLPPIEKKSPREFAPSRDDAIRQFQTLNLSPRVGVGGRIGAVPAPPPGLKLPGLSSAPRRANFTATFNGAPARRPPPLAPPPDEDVLAERRAKAAEKRQELAEQAARLAQERRAKAAEAHRRHKAKMHRAAVKIQTRVRVYVARHTLHQQKTIVIETRIHNQCVRAALVIQRIWRGCMDRHEVGRMITRLRAIRANNAARSIQRRVRGQQRRRRQQRATLRDNEAYFAHLRWRLEDDASRTIQRYVRRDHREVRPRPMRASEFDGVSDVVDVVLMEQKAHAAVLIQQQMRGRACRKSSLESGLDSMQPNPPAPAPSPPVTGASGKAAPRSSNRRISNSRGATSESLGFKSSARRDGGATPAQTGAGGGAR